MRTLFVSVISCVLALSAQAQIIHYVHSASASTPIDITLIGSNTTKDAKLAINHSTTPLSLEFVNDSSASIQFTDEVYNFSGAASVASSAIIGAGGADDPTVTLLPVLEHPNPYNGGVPVGLNGAQLDGNNYIGFSMTGDTEQGATTVYGWIRFELTNGNVFSNSTAAQITEWAYEDSGAAIMIGSTLPVPEPSACGLAFAGVVSLLFRRRRA